MAYFRKFPKNKYDFNRDGTLQTIVEFHKSVRPLDYKIDSPSQYRFYEIKNGERPDIVSQRLYNTPNYYWTFFLINDFLHDGYSSWPLSAEAFHKYLEKEYEGFAITTNPEIVRNTDQQIINFKDSLAGRFQIGEGILGSISGALGTLTQKNVDMNQLIVQNVNGAFIGDPDAINDSTENIDGQTTGDSVASYIVYKYADAPHHYFETGDAEERYVYPSTNFSENATTYAGTVPTNSLSFKTNRAHLFELNEERSKIRVLDPRFVEQFAEEFETLING